MLLGNKIKSLRDEQGILQGQVTAYLEITFFFNNRVGGKRSSFPPTFVFRPLTPPYMRFRIRRFLFWVPFDV